MVLTKDGLKLK